MVYPKELHDLHDSYPLAPEGMVPTASPFMSELAEQTQQKILKCRKLTMTLNDKNSYLVHGALLQLYLDLGMKIRQIKKVISFKQSMWLKRYIDFNSSKRQEARRNKNDFESNFFKLLNNAVYGKFIENMKNRMNFQIRPDTQKIRKQINSPKVSAFKIFNEHMVGVETRKKQVVLNRPITIGFYPRLL